MTDKTKLLKEMTEVIHFHCERDSGREELAQAVIETTADWFDDVAQSIGIAERHGNTFMANNIRNELKKLQSYPESGIHKYKWAND